MDATERSVERCRESGDVQTSVQQASPCSQASYTSCGQFLSCLFDEVFGSAAAAAAYRRSSAHTGVYALRRRLSPARDVVQKWLLGTNAYAVNVRD